MPENNVNNEIQEIKKANPWLDLFNLSDSDLEGVSILISRVMLGSDNLDQFYSKLGQKLNKSDEEVKKIALVIAKNKFLPIADKIGDVSGFIAKIGGTLPGKSKTTNISDTKKNNIQRPIRKIVNPESSASSPLSFSSEDDEEIQKIIASDISGKNHDYSSLADAIISELGYNDIIDDEILSKRFKAVIVARLKDIRDELETTEALKKSRKIGGLELDEDRSKKVIFIIRSKINQGLLSVGEKSEEKEVPTISFPHKTPFANGKTTIEAKREKSSGFKIVKAKKQLKKPTPVVVPKSPVEPQATPVEPQPAPVPPKQETFIRSEEIKKPAMPAGTPTIEEEGGLPVIKSPQGDDLMIRPESRMIEKKPVVTPPPLKPEPSKPIQKKVLDKPEQPPFKPAPREQLRREPPKPIEPKPLPLPRPMEVKRNAPMPKPIRSNRPSVDGVRVEPTLVGPVEELGTMTLINFRRLGETPHQAIAKIKEKVDLLEKESYTRKLEGIAAWHKNEINRFYRLLGNESMSGEKSVEDIITERIESNKPTLSIEEFNSIMELNRGLRY